MILKVCDASGAVKTLPLKTGTFSIGKSSDNDLVLVLPAISRRHCEVIYDGQALSLRDLGSRNGSYVDGQRVEGQCSLTVNSVVELGTTRLSFEAPVTTSPVPPVAKAPPKPPTPKPAIKSSWRAIIHQELLGDMDIKRLDLNSLSADEIRERTSAAVTKLVVARQSELPPGVTIEGVTKEIVDEAIALGPLEDLLADEDVTEIMVNNFDHIYVEKKGKLILSEKSFTDNRMVIEVIRRIIAPIGRRIDESSPMVDARLADGSRVNAIIPPLAVSGPCITIRKFSSDPFTVNNLIGFGAMTRPMADFLELVVKQRKNVCISGGTGSGKTTLLNVLSGFIPHTERIVTIEDAAELRLPQDHVVSLETKPANIEGHGAIPIRKLVMNSLRMRPDRIVVGECRGGEALDMLQAMNTGHDGSLTTLHANTCRDAIARLETLVLMAGMSLPAQAIRDQIASAIDVIVQTARLADGSRRVTDISIVTGIEGDVITLQNVFTYEQNGFDKEGNVVGEFKAAGTIPPFVQELKDRGIDVDLEIFR